MWLRKGHFAREASRPKYEHDQARGLQRNLISAVQSVLGMYFVPSHHFWLQLMIHSLCFVGPSAHHSRCHEVHKLGMNVVPDFSPFARLCIDLFLHFIPELLNLQPLPATQCSVLQTHCFIKGWVHRKVLQSALGQPTLFYLKHLVGTKVWQNWVTIFHLGIPYLLSAIGSLMSLVLRCINSRNSWW